MNASERKLLEAFDKLESGALQLQDIGDAALRVVDEQVADGLVARGLLRRGILPGAYTRTEEGRLAVSGPLDVTLYTRPGCHLCEEAKGLIAPLLQSAGGRLREVNIDADEVLRQRYNVDVPVIFLGVRKVAKHRVDIGQFQRQLNEARRAKDAGI